MKQRSDSLKFRKGVATPKLDMLAMSSVGGLQTLFEPPELNPPCGGVTNLALHGFAPCRAASSPAERLDPYNGFPLEARYDRLFDQGFITFTDTGTLVVSSALDSKDRALLDLHGDLHLRRTPTARHLPYLHYHREHIFIP